MTYTNQPWQASSQGKPGLQEDQQFSQVAKTLPSHSLGQSLRSSVTTPHVTKPSSSITTPPSQKSQVFSDTRKMLAVVGKL